MMSPQEMAVQCGTGYSQYIYGTRRHTDSSSSPSSPIYTMDSFDNFQYDTASSYGGMGVVDDTSSVYTSNTQGDVPVDLERLSVLDDHTHTSSSMENDLELQSTNGSINEDFDAVLDDLKEESQVDLPPHACWSVHPFLPLTVSLTDE